MKKKELKVSLEDYLKEDPEVTEFISEKNNNFWNNKLKISAEIPVDKLVEKDPTAVIVGKEKEIQVGKMVNYLGAQIELQREMRFADMFMLLLEVDYLKKNGFRKQIETEELEMENSPDYDWESKYKEVIKELEKKGRYNSEKTIKVLFKNLEKLVLGAESDYTKISDKLRLELPTPPTFYLEGPMGSGKSFIQRRLMLSYMKLAKEVGIKGFDVLAIRDPLDPDKPKVVKLLGGEGVKVTTYYDNVIRKQKSREKWRDRIITGGIIAFPAYYALRIGLELAKYQWGLGIGTDPLADIGMWVNRNGEWIRWITYISLGARFVSAYVKKIKRLESKRPEWLSNSKNIPPVYVGSVGRENLEGEFKENTDLAPQNWLRGSSMMASDGKIGIIEQLPELTSDEQSWLSQLIQERELSIGNKGEHTIDFFPIIYMGANPHLVKKIAQPLMDRLQLGASCYVVNEIERNLKTERKLYTFLEYYRKTKGGRPFTKEAMDALLEISSKLAEDKKKIEISRRYLSVIDNAIDATNKDKKEYIGADNVLKALTDTKSIIEQGLEVKISDYYTTSELNLREDKVGAVKILGYLTDKYMIDHKNQDIKKQLEEENGLGYVAEIEATVKEGKAGLKILTSKEWTDKKEYFEERLALLLENKIDLSKYQVIINLSKILEEDDTLLPAMYVAAVSAHEQKPIRQDKAIASSCSLDGKLLPVSKINKRLYTAPDNLSSVIVSSHDYLEKINTKLAIGPKISGEENLEKLYEVLVK